MATYPGAVKSFTTKNAGDTIQPSHVNDLQDEVNAIEDGILNGTAPVNSSRITAPALQISAGSTFLQRPVMPPPEMALVFLQSTSALGSSGASTLAWGGETFVTNAAMHSTSVNPERLIPQTTGVYRFVAQVTFGAAVSTGTFSVVIRDSSNANIGGMQIGVSSAVSVLQAVGYKRFDAIGGYAVALIGLSGQSTMSLSTGVGVTWFAMEKL